MRVLYISFIQPSEKFGGGLVVLQTLSTLCKIADIDYIGLEFDKEEFQKYCIIPHKIEIVSSNESIVERLWHLLTKGYSSKYYKDWIKVSETINPQQYDYVYMDFTRQNFVAKWAYEQKIPMIIRAHNVEADYSTSLFKNNKSVKNYVHKFVARHNERDCVNCAKSVIVLTKYEKQRFIELYGGENIKFPIIPVCVKHFEDEAYENGGKPYILITGSLWFGPNADGTEWFIKNVWSQLDKNVGNKYDLVIAGAKPNSSLKDEIQRYENIKLFDSPEKIGPFYIGASIYIAPVFYGAGMKVKVAEALSCGLPVVATRHALTGYEAASEFTYCADIADEYIRQINRIIGNRCNDREKIIGVFEENYSFSASEIKLRNILENKHIED